jgi:hypothetical protein
MTAEGWSPDRLTHTRKEPSVSTDQDNTGAQAIRDLRAFADWLEAHPTAMTRLSSTGIYDYRHDRDAFVEQARALDAGQWNQEIGQNFGLVRKWGSLTYMLYTSREVVCEEVPVDTPATEWAFSPSVAEELGAQDRMDRIGVPEVTA